MFIFKWIQQYSYKAHICLPLNYQLTVKHRETISQEFIVLRKSALMKFFNKFRMTFYHGTFYTKERKPVIFILLNSILFDFYSVLIYAFYKVFLKKNILFHDFLIPAYRKASLIL